MALINELYKQFPPRKLNILTNRPFDFTASTRIGKYILRLLLPFTLTLILSLLILSIHGCSRQEDKGKGLPPVLRIGLLPHESKVILIKHYTPLFQYLSEELEVPYELKIPSDYDDLLRQFDEGEIDLAFFGGITFLKANQKSGAVPLVMRDIDVHFTSYVISSTARPARNLEDFEGKTFTFGSALSTSGHYMPRYFLQERKIIPETFFSKVEYSGSHDKTALWIRDGIVDIGAVNPRILEEMILDGRLSSSDIHVVWETPPFSNYVWATQANIKQSARVKIRDVFLLLSPANDTHASILLGVNAGGFLPASMDDFTQLQKIALKTGLLRTTYGPDKDL